MAIQFPNNPTLNDTYVYNSITWTYNGTAWSKAAASSGGGSGASVTVDAIAPASPASGALWLNSNTGSLYIYSGTGWVLSAPGSITAADGSITTAKLATGAVTAPKIASGTDYMPMAVGTTAERPVSPAIGSMRINTDTNNLETYLNSSWLQVSPVGLGKSSANPATSVAQLRAAGITTDGIYWFSTSLVPTPFQAYVRFNYIDGGDWYLLLKVHSQGDMTSGSTYWTNNTTWNSSDFDLVTGAWAKYQTWNAFGFNRVMLEMKQGGVSKIPPIMVWNTTISSFGSAIQRAGTPADGSGLRCDITDPPLGNSQYYYSMPMKSGTNFTNTGSVEGIIQHYGIGCWADPAVNSTTAEGFPSLGRAGAWIGAPMDEGGHTFNNVTNANADSSFGFGIGGGNPAKTTSAGYTQWSVATSTNTLPAYVWIR